MDTVFGQQPCPPLQAGFQAMKNDQMILRGALCTLIGATVLLGPHVLRSEGWREILAGAQTVGWFALVLGLALIVVGVLRRNRR